MAYHTKRPVSEHVYQDMEVWQCTTCDCWSRMEFVLVEEPTCPLCQSAMEKQTKNIRME